jgi:hypothetical protein
VVAGGVLGRAFLPSLRASLAAGARVGAAGAALGTAPPRAALDAAGAGGFTDGARGLTDVAVVDGLAGGGADGSP